MSTGRTKLAGVVGWPITHSRSPQLHGYWLKHYGIDGAYLPLPVNPENLGEALRALSKLGFAGANLTIPHKEAAVSLVDDIDSNAKRIGAVNTIVVTANGQLSGSNTDGFGFIEHLRHTIPQWTASNGPAVLLGAGGAARAAAFALLDAGVPEIRIINRTVGRAHNLVECLDGKARTFAWSDAGRAMQDAALLANATSLGLSGQPALDLPLTPLPKSAIVYDIVYAPLETELLVRARTRGNPVVDGLGMLLHQARPGFKAWFGVDPEVTAELRAVVSED